MKPSQAAKNKNVRAPQCNGLRRVRDLHDDLGRRPYKNARLTVTRRLTLCVATAAVGAVAVAWP